MTAIILLGLANWITTVILVESEITRPLRDWLDLRADMARMWVDGGGDDVTNGDRAGEIAWRKTGYLAHCYLCAGTWVALAMALVTSARPLGDGLVGWLLAALAIKAVGHLTLEVSHLLTTKAKVSA